MIVLDSLVKVCNYIVIITIHSPSPAILGELSRYPNAQKVVEQGETRFLFGDFIRLSWDDGIVIYQTIKKGLRCQSYYEYVPAVVITNRHGTMFIPHPQIRTSVLWEKQTALHFSIFLCDFSFMVQWVLSLRFFVPSPPLGVQSQLWISLDGQYGWYLCRHLSGHPSHRNCQFAWCHPFPKMDWWPSTNIRTIY